MTSLRQKLQAIWHRVPFQRQFTFGAVGIYVMAISYLSLIFQISVLGITPWLAYVVQAFIAIELNFVLNHVITWRDRPVQGFSGLLRRFAKFNVTRWALAFPFNLLMFAGLVSVGVNYLIANTVCIGAVTIINYVVGDRFVFTHGKDQSQAIDFSVQVKPRDTTLTTVSVIIPVKRSHKTIRLTVDSLLAQDYKERSRSS